MPPVVLKLFAGQDTRRTNRQSDEHIFPQH